MGSVSCVFESRNIFKFSFSESVPPITFRKAESLPRPSTMIGNIRRRPNWSDRLRRLVLLAVFLPMVFLASVTASASASAAETSHISGCSPFVTKPGTGKNFSKRASAIHCSSALLVNLTAIDDDLLAGLAIVLASRPETAFAIVIISRLPWYFLDLFCRETFLSILQIIVWFRFFTFPIDVTLRIASSFGLYIIWSFQQSGPGKIHDRTSSSRRHRSCPSISRLFSRSAFVILLLFVCLQCGSAVNGIHIPEPHNGEVRVLIGSNVICYVAKEWCDLARSDAGPNLIWRKEDVPTTNYLAQIVYGWWEYDTLCALCQKEGLPMPFLPEVIGHECECKDENDLLRIVCMILLHYPGHKYAKYHAKGGFVGRDDAGDIHEPVIYTMMYVLKKLAHKLRVEQADAVPPTIVWDMFPWVMDNKSDGLWILDDKYADIRKALAALQVKFFTYMVEKRSLKRLIRIGDHTFDQFNSLLGGILPESVLSILTDFHSVPHPAYLLYGGRNAELLRKLYVALSHVWGNSNCTEQIWQLTDSEVKGLYGSIKIEDIWPFEERWKGAAKPTEKKEFYVVESPLHLELRIVMSSMSAVGRLIGCQVGKVSSFIAGRKESGEKLAPGESLEGNNFHSLTVRRIVDAKSTANHIFVSTREANLSTVEQGRQTMERDFSDLLRLHEYFVITAMSNPGLCLALSSKKTVCSLIGISSVKLDSLTSSQPVTVDGKNYAGITVELIELLDRKASEITVPGRSMPVPVLKLEHARQTMETDFSDLLRPHEYFVITAKSNRDLCIALSSKTTVCSLIGCHQSKLNLLTSSQPVTVDGKNYAGITVELIELLDRKASEITVPGRSMPVPVLKLEHARQTMETDFSDLLRPHEYFVITAKSNRDLCIALSSKTTVCSLIGCDRSNLNLLTSSQPVTVDGTFFAGITVALIELPGRDVDEIAVPGRSKPVPVLNLEDARQTMETDFSDLLRPHEYFVITAKSNRDLCLALSCVTDVLYLIGISQDKLNSLTSSQPVTVGGRNYVGITVELIELPDRDANEIFVPGRSAPLPVLTLDQAKQTMEEYRDLSTNKRFRSDFKFKRVVVPRSDSTNPLSSFGLSFTRSTQPNDHNTYIAEDHLSGLRRGDVVCAVNGVMVLNLQTGRPIRSFSDAMSVIRATKEGGELILQVLSRK